MSARGWNARQEYISSQQKPMKKMGKKDLTKFLNRQNEFVEQREARIKSLEKALTPNKADFVPRIDEKSRKIVEEAYVGPNVDSESAIAIRERRSQTGSQPREIIKQESQMMPSTLMHSSNNSVGSLKQE